MGTEKILAPSMLSADFNHLAQDLKTVQDNGAEYLHIDVMDGVFVQQISMGMPVIASIRKESSLFFDVHLMIVEPIRYIETFADCGADLITFHLEAANDIQACIDAIRGKGKKVGISIKPKTPVKVVLPWLDQIDMLLIMTVEPGFGGQKYIPASTEKIREARAYITENGLNCDIEVDGGINKDTVDIVLEAGANVLVAGSACFGGDVASKTAFFISKMKGAE